MEGAEQHRRPQARPLRSQLLPWLQGSLPTPCQARLALLLSPGGQAASLGGRGECSPDKLWPMGPQSQATPPRASHGRAEALGGVRELSSQGGWADAAEGEGRARCEGGEGTRGSEMCPRRRLTRLRLAPDHSRPGQIWSSQTRSQLATPWAPRPSSRATARSQTCCVRAGEATSPDSFTAEETDARRGTGWSGVIRLRSQAEPSWARAPSRRFDNNPTQTDNLDSLSLLST